MLKGLFASSSWLRVCVGAFAALAIVLATAAPASAADRGPSPSHATTAFRGGGHGGGAHGGFHGGYHGGGAGVRHWSPRFQRHFRGPRHVPPFRRY